VRCLAIVGLAVAAIAAGCGSETPAAGACSAATVPEPAAQDLPAPVAEARQLILDAAVACDYAALEEIGREGNEAFTFSFGGGPSPRAYWERLEASGDRPLASLVTVLGLSSTLVDGRIHAWPAAHGEGATDDDWRAVVDAGLLTESEADAMRAQGSGYLGWRVGIAADGEWLFFVAGD